MRPNMVDRLPFNLRTYMQRAGVNQAELAKATGLVQPTISRMLAGHVPRDKALLALAVFFHITVDDLLWREVDDTSTLRMNWKGIRIPYLRTTADLDRYLAEKDKPQRWSST